MTGLHPVITALRAERVRRGWTQTGLARLIGCDRDAISGWENGQHSPGLGNLAVWAAALDRQIIAVPVLCDGPS